MVGMTRAALVPELPELGKKKPLNQHFDASVPGLAMVSTVVSQRFACTNTRYFAVINGNLSRDEYMVNAG